jgi:hypothetical protein
MKLFFFLGGGGHRKAIQDRDLWGMRDHGGDENYVHSPSRTLEGK